MRLLLGRAKQRQELILDQERKPVQFMRSSTPPSAINKKAAENQRLEEQWS